VEPLANKELPMAQLYAPLSLVHHRIFGRVHVVLLDADKPTDHPESQYAYFDLSDFKCNRQGEHHTVYPVSILMLHNFSQRLDELIQRNPHRCTALRVVPSVEAETIAALLLGTYMVMRLDISSDDAMKRLEGMNIAPLQDELLPAVCKEIFSPSQHQNRKKSGADACSKLRLLLVRDCLDAMKLAKSLHWINLSGHQSDDSHQGPALDFDAEEYEFLNNPLNADLTEVSLLRTIRAYPIDLNRIHISLHILWS
jgi:hypothetical protein